jgi:hypothetical protein
MQNIYPMGVLVNKQLSWSFDRFNHEFGLPPDLMADSDVVTG